MMLRARLSTALVFTLMSSACSKGKPTPSASPIVSAGPVSAPVAPHAEASTPAKPAVLAPADAAFLDTRHGWGWSDRCLAHLHAGAFDWARGACDRGLAMTDLDPKARAALAFNQHLIAKKSARAAEDPASPVADRATACFKSPTCSLEEGARLYADAARAGSLVTDCWRFYEGVGAPKDLALARSCIARADKDKAGAGSLPPWPIDALVLATMMLDGQGGPVDTAGAADVASNVGGEEALAAFRAEQSKIAKGSMTLRKLCEAHAKNTLDFNECKVRERTRFEFAIYAQEHRLAALDASKLAPLLRTAGTAWGELANAIGLWSSDAYRGGTMSDGQWFAILASLAGERAAMLAGLDAYQPPFGNLATEEARLKAAMSAELNGDEESRELVRKVDAAFAKYRVAERAMLVALFATRGPSAPDAKDIDAALMASERARIARIKASTVQGQ